MNIDLKDKILNWEIGNECFGNWEQGYNVAGLGTVTGAEYGEDFKVFAAAMKAVDPTIKVDAVLWQTNETWSGQVLTQVKDVADFLIVHEYFTGVTNITPAMVLQSVPVIKVAKDTINNWVVQYAGKPINYYPIALTEFNSRGYSTTNMTNGLFFSSILGEIVKNGYGFSNSWVNEWTSEPIIPHKV
jgi:alpha-L-arabinofuranosidase